MRFIYTLKNDDGEDIEPLQDIEANDIGHAMQRLAAALPEIEVSEIWIRGVQDRDPAPVTPLDLARERRRARARRGVETRKKRAAGQIAVWVWVDASESDWPVRRWVPRERIEEAHRILAEQKAGRLTGAEALAAIEALDPPGGADEMKPA
jgi:hypothetical protein